MQIHRCVQATRLFTNRMLQLLRKCPNKGSILLTRDFFKDLNWFCHFLQVFNGLVERHTVESIGNVIYEPSSFQEMGAHYNGEVFSTSIVHSLVNNMSIVHLEAANIILTLNYWKKSLKNSHIVIWCDNFAVVNAFTHHKIVRTVWLICAVYNIKLNVKHIRGIENTYADILSRLSFYNDKSASGCSQTIMICCQTSRYRGL